MVPWEIYQHYTGNMVQPALSTLRDLIAIVSANESHAEVTDYAAICCQLLGQLASSLVSGAGITEPMEVEADVLRHGLLLVLKAYGTPDEDIEKTGLSWQAEGHSSHSKLAG